MISKGFLFAVACAIILALIEIVTAADASAQSGPLQIAIDSLETVEDQEEYEVLTALLKDVAMSKNPPQQIVLSRVSLQSNWRSGSGFIENALELDSVATLEVLHDLINKDRLQRRWEARFDLAHSYRWEDYEHPPKDMCHCQFQMSRVGFDSLRQNALVHLARVSACGERFVAAEYRLIHLQKSGRCWFVKKNTLAMTVN